MKTLSTVDRGKDPCLQIQIDLSAMLDGELDAPSVRRVMVHSDVCNSCRGFLKGIRTQARAHRELSSHELIGAGGEIGPGRPTERAQLLRKQLTENRLQLSRILYELGRGFALMGLSPDFSREVAREPVPVPDMAMRGRNLLDEVERLAHGTGAEVSGEWVRAKELFSQGHLRTPAENLAKGQRLLTECVTLTPEHYQARIYLGLVHHVRGQRGMARKQFAAVLTGTDDSIIRAFALVNLGNVFLDEGDCEGAIELFLQLVETGIIAKQPRFGMAYFNLALAYGLLERFDESRMWFRRLHDELPHKRPSVARELSRRRHFLHILKRNPDELGRLTRDFPAWFPVTAKEAC